ncbi:hypothetical protein [Acaryochloris sp. CCMEE 5410]|uniref:hypothetical protein n=1 Tax=Acaryochloris sp. CCMEE 5410 TaxID=310037 RepID=UPI0002483BC6|nr:hypothetical protein [Acaryochloris sp. CCMEE 5410]KAI9134564.1 hypothetical protein ON05_015650 [Acaryochloris sp. CCMEE 5410]
MILILWPFVKPRPFISIIFELVMVKRGQRFLDFKRIGERDSAKMHRFDGEVAWNRLTRGTLRIILGKMNPSCERNC